VRLRWPVTDAEFALTLAAFMICGGLLAVLIGQTKG
jgi:hypothetical protein